MTDREALKLALEALEEMGGGYSQNLIAALKERLAQPEQEPVAFEEWLSKQHGDPEEIGFLQALRIAYISGQDSITTPPQPERHELQAKGEHPAPCARHCEATAFQIVIKNLKAQLAQPEQEPVAWVTGWHGGHCVIRAVDPAAILQIGTALYTATPQRKPLTDEEIDTLVIGKDGLPNSHLEFARAIEAAHGIKENRND